MYVCAYKFTDGSERGKNAQGTVVHLLLVYLKYVLVSLLMAGPRQWGGGDEDYTSELPPPRV